MNTLLNETQLLDYSNNAIQNLIHERNWNALDEVRKVKAIYTFVRDEILFGYNTQDNIPASQVLKDGYGQCNTKATLLMALLRACKIPCRIHGFTIDKALQKGAITGFWYVLAPKNILHSWVEVFTNNEWFYLEGVILDKPYLTSLQRKNIECTTNFCGYGVFTENFQNPTIDWNLNHTYIQRGGINQDFGVFDAPDDFYKKHQQEISKVKQFMYKVLIRKLMNRNVNRIRRQLK